MAAWALPYNNPMAIIQARPDDWVGLVAGASGKLKFNTMSNGVRAGVINLYNGYFKKGNNTLRGIFKVYAPSGHGANDPLNYATIVSQKIGVGIDQPLIFSSIVNKLSRAIVQVETGSDISSSDFNNGLNEALLKLALIRIDSTGTKVWSTPDKIKNKSNWIWWVVLPVVGYLALKRK
tara:strand:+ start:915 stop:1448 length:534 start_codon:yes stop_codon:yes gene_type:complete